MAGWKFSTERRGTSVNMWGAAVLWFVVTDPQTCKKPSAVAGRFTPHACGVLLQEVGMWLQKFCLSVGETNWILLYFSLSSCKFLSRNIFGFWEAKIEGTLNRLWLRSGKMILFCLLKALRFRQPHSKLVLKWFITPNFIKARFEHLGG